MGRRVARESVAPEEAARSSLGEQQPQGALALTEREQQQVQAQKQLLHLLPQLVRLGLPTGRATSAAGKEPLTRGLLHGFLPAVIPDRVRRAIHVSYT